ncbi:MAG: GTP 3',8-cyclase MoaA [Bacillota bacterium]|nr:GTP 3',8-cyclase MoaA [Bacillota bacterium]
MIDKFQRYIDYIRISITDRCNLRCRYCMPEQGLPSISHDEVLSYEELLRLARVFAALGVSKYKITGGEPLVRRGCAGLVARLKELPGVEQVTLTTNGVLLAEQIAALEKAGLDAVNISLDTLKPDKFRYISRLGDLSRVLAGLEAALASGIPRVKTNTVPQRGFNDDELIEIAQLARHDPLAVRFIEVMPIGEGSQYQPIDNTEVLALLEARFGAFEPLAAHIYGNGPARHYQPPGFVGKIGLISAVSHAFCSECNRLRLTADGKLKLCLYYNDGVDLRAALRGGSSDQQLMELIAAAVMNKPKQHDFARQQDAGNAETGCMSGFGG